MNKLVKLLNKYRDAFSMKYLSQHISMSQGTLHNKLHQTEIGGELSIKQIKEIRETLAKLLRETDDLTEDGIRESTFLKLTGLLRHTVYSEEEAEQIYYDYNEPYRSWETYVTDPEGSEIQFEDKSKRDVPKNFKATLNRIAQEFEDMVIVI